MFCIDSFRIYLSVRRVHVLFAAVFAFMFCKVQFTSVLCLSCLLSCKNKKKKEKENEDVSFEPLVWRWLLDRWKDKPRNVLEGSSHFSVPFERSVLHDDRITDGVPLALVSGCVWSLKIGFIFLWSKRSFPDKVHDPQDKSLSLSLAEWSPFRATYTSASLFYDIKKNTEMTLSSRQ